MTIRVGPMTEGPLLVRADPKSEVGGNTIVKLLGTAPKKYFIVWIREENGKPKELVVECETQNPGW